MVHFYNGSKDEDYTTLVDNEILEKIEGPELQVTDLNLDFEKEPKTVEKKRCTENVLFLRIVKIFLLLTLLTTIAALSYRAYTQDSKIQFLEAKYWGSFYTDEAIECKFSVSDGQLHRVRGRGMTRDRTREFKGLTGNACLTACLNVREYDPRINGVTVSMDPQKRDCWCVRNVTEVATRFRSCIFESNQTKHNISVDISKYNCEFKRGDGSGGTEVKVGQQNGAECIKACLYLKQFDNTINGVNTYLDPRKGGCWCERGMTSIGWSSTFRTCTLLPKDSHTAKRVDPAVCSFMTGHPMTPYHLSRFLITVKQTAPQCVEDCMHMKRVDPSVNGVTVKTDDGRCWCIKGMKNITTMYKTCFLNGSTTCLMQNTFFNGSALLKQSNVTSWLECSDLCREEDKCRYWTFNITSQTCTLVDDKAKKVSLPSHVSGAKECGKNVCNYIGSVRPGAYRTYRKMGEETGKACAVKCLNLKRLEPSVNGATVYLDAKRKGCFCNYNLTSIDQSYKTCFLNPPKSEKKFDVSDMNVTCDLVSGDGYGGSEVFLSNLPGDSCLKACLFLSKIDPSVNGMTVYANKSRPGCWCEKQMGDIKQNPTLKACKFKYKGEESVDTSSFCKFSHGESDGTGTYVGRLGQKECARTCSHVTHLDRTLSGITWDMVSNSCYCKRNMTRIGKYKTCMLKDVKLTE